MASLAWGYVLVLESKAQSSPVQSRKLSLTNQTGLRYVII